MQTANLLSAEYLGFERMQVGIELQEFGKLIRCRQSRRGDYSGRAGIGVVLLHRVADYVLTLVLQDIARASGERRAVWIDDAWRIDAVCPGAAVGAYGVASKGKVAGNDLGSLRGDGYRLARAQARGVAGFNGACA